MTPVLQRPVRERLAVADLAIVALLLLACYAPALQSLAGDWWHDDNMGHGFFVPFVAAYIVWQEKDELRKLPLHPSWWGLLVVILGAIQCLLGTLGVELFIARSALIVTLTGVVWALGGVAWLKKLAFPLVLLCFMVPLPALIYNSLTFPLQILATELAAAALGMLGVPVLREGNVLQLPSGPLSVVEACSGIRSLLSLTFLSLVYGYFFEQRRWVRIALLLATIPIAILANGGRVTITGVLSMIRPELAQGFFHESTGWVIFMLALVILVAFHRLLVRGIHAWTGRQLQKHA